MCVGAGGEHDYLKDDVCPNYLQFTNDKHMRVG